MPSFLNIAAQAAGHGIIFYFVILNLFSLMLSVISLLTIVRHMRRNEAIDYRSLVRSPQVTPISIIAPAYNEEASIVSSILSLLRLDYSSLEVIAVNDGSKDGTLEAMKRAFSLRRTRRLYLPSIRTQTVRGIYVSRLKEWRHLVVVDKENGGKADALNVGINVARHPLFCAIDADSILSQDALLRIVTPFLEDDRTVAVGGNVRIANECTSDRGRVTEVRLPNHWIPLFQVVEYLRAFLTARMGWSAMNALLIISGAFGLFRRDVVMACGGYRHDTVGEDMELIARIHKYFRDRREPYRVVFLPDPVCWTEAPGTLRGLSRQRNRWYRGLADTLMRHRSLFLRPRYGAVGMVAVPYFVFFELLAPVLEVLGYVLLVPGVMLGFFTIADLILFFTVAVAYGVFFSVGAVLLEELSFRRYERPMELLRLVLGAVVENFGYRQLTVLWRIAGLMDYLRGVQSWGVIQRVGFSSSHPHLANTHETHAS